MKRLWVALWLALGVSGTAMAQPQSSGWPEKLITIIVPYPAGGAVDVIMRTISARMAESLGQSIVVLSRPGASSDLGASVVARAQPNGYTLLATSQWFTLNPMMENDMQWSARDFTPAALLARSPNYIAVANQSPWKTLDEYVRHARANPGLFYGSTGVGSTQELVMDRLISASGINLSPVLYKGAPPIIVDLIGGRLSIAAVAAANAIAPAKGGQIRLLASSAGQPSSLHANVPTLKQLGYAKVDMSSWYGIHAPAGTPAAIVRKIEASAREAMHDPKVVQRLAQLDAQPSFLGAVAFSDFLAQQDVEWAPVVKAEVQRQQTH